MSGIIPGYNYDIFISYRQKDNKYDGWVTEFVDHLKSELEATFKDEISLYFDINPHDGLLETHDVDASLREKLKCLIFIPVISRTYCDPKSFAWEHEFKAFVEQASRDQFGLKVKLPNGTGDVGQPEPRTEILRKVFVEIGKEIIEDRAGHSPQGLLGEPGSGGVDRNDGEGLFFVPILVQDLEVGVRELHRSAPDVDPAIEENPDSRKEHFFKAHPVEPHGPGHGPAVRDECRDDGKPFSGCFPPLESRHPRCHRDSLTAPEG